MCWKFSLLAAILIYFYIDYIVYMIYCLYFIGQIIYVFFTLKMIYKIIPLLVLPAVDIVTMT